jgi:hypothetical protein
MLKIINVVGARPNFMKVAPLMEAMKRRVSSTQPPVPPLWDGHTADRILDVLTRDPKPNS